MIDLYYILGVSRQASQTEIKTAFKKLALTYHPDKNVGNHAAEERFKEINGAYQILTNPTRKAEYDQLLKQESTGRHRDPYYRKKAEAFHKQQTYTTPHTPPFEAKPPMTKLEVASWIIGGLFVAILLFGGIRLSLHHYDARLKLEEAIHEYFINHRVARAQSLLSTAIERDDSFAEPYLLYGQIVLENDGETKQGVFLLSKGLMLTDEPEAKHYFLRAKGNYQLEQFKNAYADLKRGLALQPDNVDALQLIGELELYFHQDYKTAISYFDKILQAKPSSQAAHLQKAVASIKLKAYSNAHQSLNEALALNPKDGVVYHYMGINNLEHYKDTINACHLWKYALDLGVMESKRYIHQYCSSSTSP